MNIKLLRKIQAKARKYPKTIQMDWWADGVNKDKAHPCGTVACIAGTAVLIENPRLMKRWLNGEAGWGMMEKGAELIGLTPLQSYRLFIQSSWPRRFSNGYDQAKRPETRAKWFTSRIDHFIKTKGAK